MSTKPPVLLKKTVQQIAPSAPTAPTPTATANSTMVEILRAIKRERMYQDLKWGTVEMHPHTIPEWLLIFENIVEKGKREWLEGAAPDLPAHRLLQIAATAWASLEQHGLVERIISHAPAPDPIRSNPESTRGASPDPTDTSPTPDGAPADPGTTGPGSGPAEAQSGGAEGEGDHARARVRKP